MKYGWILVLLLLAGCTPPPFPSESLTAPGPKGLAQMASADWPGSGNWTIRHSGRLDLWWKTLSFTLLVKVSPEEQVARVAALDDHMGVTLFALRVEGDRVNVLKAIPQLERFPSLLHRVGQGIGRIYFSSRRLPVAGRTAEGKTLVLIRQEQEALRRQIYTGVPLRRLSQRNDTKGWRVGYFRFEDLPEGLIPTGIVYNDDPAGLELVLWLEQIRRQHDGVGGTN